MYKMIRTATSTGYRYYTKHGVGPGTLPKDVKLLDWKDLDNNMTEIWLDRFLTTRELNYYDIYPETMNNELDKIYQSSNIESSDSYKYNGANYEFVTNIDGYWVYLADVDGKGTWRAMPQGSDKSEFSRLSFPISYNQARGFEPINEPSAITKLRKDLGKKLLSKSGRSVEATTEYLDIGGILGEPNARYSSEDLRSIYEEEKHHDPLISIYEKGKHHDPLISQYDSYESWFKDIEQYLYEIYSDTDDITSSTDDKVFIEDIIDGLEEHGYDLTRISSIKRGIWELFGYKEKDADIIIHDLIAGGFIDPNDWVDKDYIPSIYSSTEEDEGDLPMVDQEYDSAATSINSNKLPAIYRMVNFNEGDVVVDFGGGKFDNAVEYIRDKGATLCVYDPYNRSAEHNKEVLRILRENGGADAAVNSNVLNVIKEPEARKNVLENIARITKPGAPIYITVYEGKGNGQEGPTKSGYQLNRKTADYLEEIQEVFPDATRKGKLIIARNSKSIKSSYDIISSIKGSVSPDEFFTKDDLIDLCNEIEYAVNRWIKIHVNQLLISDSFYTSDAWIEGNLLHIELSNSDYTLSNETRIDMRKIRAPKDLMKYKTSILSSIIDQLMELLDDTDDTVEGAIYTDLDRERDLARAENDWLERIPYDGPEEFNDVEELVEVSLDLNVYIDNEQELYFEEELDEDYSYEWASDEGKSWYSEKYPDIKLGDSDDVAQAIAELLYPHIPARPGWYHVKGLANLYYNVEGVTGYKSDYNEDKYDYEADYVEYNNSKSNISNLKVAYVGQTL